MQISIIDWTNGLNARHQVGIDFLVAPPQAHYQNGMAERSIKSVKELLDKVYRNQRLSALSYQTAFQWTSNELNNLPLMLGSNYESFDKMDLITPNRLLKGSNIERCPSGPAVLATPSKAIQHQKKVYEAWVEAWKDQTLQSFIPRGSKWKTSSISQPEVDDAIVFTKKDQDSLGESMWTLGRVKSVEKSKDDKVRKLKIEYRNIDEKVFRETERTPREIAIIHKEGELAIVEQMNVAAKEANLAFIKENLP